MAYVAVNGTELYYEEAGEGPPLVFAHGVGGNHASWFQQTPSFSRWYRVITIDQRGFGLTEDSNNLGRSGFVDDLRLLLDALGIGRTAIVAQSMGGSTAMGFTVRYPERVSALVMADTLVGITLPEELRAVQQERAQQTRDLSQLERVVSASFPQRQPEMAKLYLQIASFNKSNASRFTMGGAPAAPITMEQVMTAAQTVPMLFLVGQEDILQPPDIVAAASRLVPNARLVVVSGAGHSDYWEQPQVFNHVVQAFLSEVMPRD